MCGLHFHCILPYYWRKHVISLFGFLSFHEWVLCTSDNQKAVLWITCQLQVPLIDWLSCPVSTVSAMSCYRWRLGCLWLPWVSFQNPVPQNRVNGIKLSIIWMSHIADAVAESGPKTLVSQLFWCKPNTRNGTSCWSANCAMIYLSSFRIITECIFSMLGICERSQQCGRNEFEITLAENTNGYGRSFMIFFFKIFMNATLKYEPRL